MDESYSETELMSLYEDLLAFPEPRTEQDSTEEAQPETDEIEALRGLARRLFPKNEALHSTRDLGLQDSSGRLDAATLSSDQLPPHHAFIHSLQQLVKIHKMFPLVGTAPAAHEAAESSSVPTEIEWRALVGICVSISFGAMITTSDVWR